MSLRIRTPQLKKKIKRMERYIGPKVDYSSDHWPEYEPDRWLFEYLFELKTRYYRRKNKKKK